MKIKIVLTTVMFFLFLFSCEKDKDDQTEKERVLELEDYFPLAKGAKWDYKVNFPSKVSVPYKPIIVAPDGILCASGICGLKSYNAGDVYFNMLIISDENSKKCDVTFSETGLEFYFNLFGDIKTELQLNIINNTAQLDLFAYLSDDFIIKYKLVNISEDDFSQKHSITVPAGTFENCIKSVVNIKGDGSYVPLGSYPVETYLAPDIGIVKTIGKDKDGTVLYTSELTEELPEEDNAICESFENDCGDGTFSICCSDSSCTTMYYLYNGKRYYCEGDDCTEAVKELIKDMCGL